MSLFFGPRKRVTVARPLAVTLNVLNLLAPVLLALAVVLIGITKFWPVPEPLRRALIQWGTVFVFAGFAIRIVWGIGLRVVRRQDEGRNKMQDDGE